MIFGCDENYSLVQSEQYELQAECEKTGGLWGSVDGICIADTCFDDSSCPQWYGSSGHCMKLRVGDTQRKLYHYLGQPINEVDGYKAFKGSPPEDEVIKAKVKDGVIEEINCGGA